MIFDAAGAGIATDRDVTGVRCRPFSEVPQCPAWVRNERQSGRLPTAL